MLVAHECSRTHDLSHLSTNPIDELDDVASSESRVVLERSLTEEPEAHSRQQCDRAGLAGYCTCYRPNGNSTVHRIKMIILDRSEYELRPM